MTCSSCSGTIERALLSTGGIYSAKISLLTERCEVVFDDRVITANKIIEEIEDVGFEARSDTPDDTTQQDTSMQREARGSRRERDGYE